MVTATHKATPDANGAGSVVPPSPASPGQLPPLDVSTVLPGLPQAGTISNLPGKKTTAGKAEAETSPALADLPPLPAPGSSEPNNSGPDLSKADAPPPLPNISDVAPPPDNLLPLTATGSADSKPISLPEIKVSDDKPKVKSWQTVLAPAIIPPKTNFDYKRETLPPPIYRTGYRPYNHHLPVAISRQDYANLLFMSVSRNDVERTRALLNAGTPINVVAMNGETPLATARRLGAQETAQLLVARGGHY